MEVNNIDENNPLTLKETKKKRNKFTKEQTYKEQREKIIVDLEKLMGLTDTNRGVLLYDLENNENVKKYLTEIIPNVKKYYKCGNWGFFSKTVVQGMGNEIGLLKAIFKNEKFTITSRRKTIIINNEKKLSTILYFIKI
jgi:hypothetical protein